ncbi:hypothetical protein PTKIN_Ptkin08bG0096200 [Pterospermum kingtungense]
MLDYQTYQIVQSNCDGAGDIEFDFWSARKSCYYDTFNNLDGCEIEFQVGGCVEERFGHCPIPLWEADKITDASPLLPNNHFYSNVSPTRKQAIEEGRKQLMEMIRNMPESSYELSLKDIVDDQQQLETVREKAVSEYHKSIHLETETQIKKQKKKKRKACPISTSGSMDADNFLIKMFFPSSQSLKIKKSTAENSSNVSPSPSSEKPVDKQWWIKRIFHWKGS